MNLRGHHLLCIFGWKGHGYSEQFNEAMDEVVANLKNPDVIIMTKIEPDQVCKRCPNVSSKGCYKDEEDKEEQIQAHDKRVLDFLGLTPETQISVQDLKNLIAKKKPYENLASLCGDCMWIEVDYCKNGLRHSIDN